MKFYMMFYELIVSAPVRCFRVFAVKERLMGPLIGHASFKLFDVCDRSCIASNVLDHVGV